MAAPCVPASSSGVIPARGVHLQWFGLYGPLCSSRAATGLRGPIPGIVIDMPEVATPPALVAGATRERILIATAALIYRDGVAGTSLNDVRAATEAASPSCITTSATSPPRSARSSNARLDLPRAPGL